MGALTQPVTHANSTDEHTRFALPSFLVPTLCGVAAVISGACVLIGWAYDIEILKRLKSEWTPVNPTTALSLGLIGLVLASYSSTARLQWVRATLGLIVAAIGLVKLIAVLHGTESFADTLLFAAKLKSTDVTSPNSALCLMLLGLGSICHAGAFPRIVIVGRICIIGALFIAFTALVGHAAGIFGFYRIGDAPPIRLQTAATCLVLGIGFLGVRVRSPRQKNPLPFSISLLTVIFTVLFVILGASFWGEVQSDMTEDLSFQTQTWILESDQVLSTLQDAEIGQRGYLLTEDEEYLKPYSAAISKIEPLRAGIQRRAAAAGGGPTAGARLQELITQKLEILAATIELQRNGHRAEALALEKTGRGKELMDQIRDMIANVNLRRSKALAQEVEQRAKVTIAVRTTEILGLLLLVIAGAAVFRQTQATMAAQRQANESQEAAVVAATSANNAKSAFLASMSHELRTPMTAIIGMADLLLGSEQTKDHRQITQMLSKSAHALLVLLNDILDLSKIEAGRLALEVVDFRLSSVLQDVNALLGPVASRKGLVLDIDYRAATRDVFKGDAKRLQQVLINLIGNAIKFTKDGSVTVRCNCRLVDDLRTNIQIEVRDTGPGISPEAQKRLFREFEQEDASTYRKFGGSGLGLSICKKLLQAMGGSIGVESVKGEGSRFFFEVSLPAGDESAVRERRDVSIAAAIKLLSGRRLNILLAEDTDASRFLVTQMLSSWGHEVLAVSNGAEAVAAATERAWDVILMDMHMPLLDGPEATARIRAGGGPSARTRIIALTADAVADHHGNYLAAGCDAVVLKPIDWSVLASTIASLSGIPQQSFTAASVSTAATEAKDPAAMTMAEMIAELRDSLGQAALEQLAEAMIEELPNYVDEVRRAIDRDDLVATRRAAHKIKGISSQFAARACREIARRIEEEAGDISECRALLGDLERCATTAATDIVALVKTEGLLDLARG